MWGLSCGMWTLLVGSCEIFLVAECRIFFAACGILLWHVGSLFVAFWIFVKASGVFNCGRRDLHCAMESFKLWYVGSFMQHERFFFFFFAACGILAAARRSYKLSHVGSLLQHARSFYFWHAGSFVAASGSFSHGMWDLCSACGSSVGVCGIFLFVACRTFIVACGIFHVQHARSF